MAKHLLAGPGQVFRMYDMEKIGPIQTHVCAKGQRYLPCGLKAAKRKSPLLALLPGRIGLPGDVMYLAYPQTSVEGVNVGRQGHIIHKFWWQVRDKNWH